MLVNSSSNIVCKTDVQNIVICICKYVNKKFLHWPKLQFQKYLKRINE